MDIVSAFAAPRLVSLAGREFWLRPYRLEDLGLIIGWIDDATPGWREANAMAPPFSSDEAQAALNSQYGVVVLAWAALRHQGLSYEESAALAVKSTPDEWARFQEVVFGRRRYLTASGGEDLAEAWWGPSICILAERYHLSIDQIGAMTLDQLDCFAGEGLEDENPLSLSIDDVQAMWEASRARAEAERN